MYGRIQWVHRGIFLCHSPNKIAIKKPERCILVPGHKVQLNLRIPKLEGPITESLPLEIYLLLISCRQFIFCFVKEIIVVSFFHFLGHSFSGLKLLLWKLLVSSCLIS
ncbi:hypothetical protein LWI29_011207 [Acer saccharum]|uniref:Uncharacterized protein n=1 Tax=Acer saccharum TaxID=4024 RepID=A0AA39VDF6_ACESA|nr:hypothetical protein LWI29_011207 [Acer saccharum]